jgi:ACS family glucarate transporter-like MFS transporter
MEEATAKSERFSPMQRAVIAVAMSKAFLLYLDRTCMGAVVQSASFQQEMALDKAAVGSVMSSFFLAYALGQMPAGWLADRFGSRRMLVIYVVLWSVCTALTGWVQGLTALVLVRMACGLSEAGAYPAITRLVGSWFGTVGRARASGLVAMGGRIGNALALGFTAWAIARFHGWRPVLWVYGLAGMILAFAGWRVLRDSPTSGGGQDERDRVAVGGVQVSVPWRALLTDRGLWIFNVGAIGMNLGWAFLITWLPSYLREVHGLDPVVSGTWISWALAFGMTGMIAGGWYGDFCVRRFGVRWGRRLPMLTGGVCAAVCYGVAPFLPGPGWVVAACGFVAFASDSVTPSIWGMVQDIGGGRVASTMAWVNMWGNLGASLIAKVIPILIASRWHCADWRETFFLCALGFLTLGLSALAVDAGRRLGAQSDA